jgi:hypothetical protein
MKTIVLATGVVALCVGSAQADLLVAAPGLENAVFLASSGLSNTASLTIAPASDPDAKYSEYRITGIEYVLKGGIPDGGSLKNNGGTLDAEGKAVTIDNSVRVVVKYDGSTVIDKSQTLTVDNNKDSLTGSFSLSGDVVANDKSITIEVTQSFDGGVLAGDYSYLVIEGTYTENSPEPEGFIQRKTSTMTTVLTSEDVCDVEFGVSSSLLDSGSTDGVANNDGFGNNEDGIDGSNKNAVANASKWARSGKIDLTNETMVTLLDDDEM